MRRFSVRPGVHLKGRKFHGLRGFDGKPFHPPLTDIPIGAYVIAPVLDLIAFLVGGGSGQDLHRAAGLVYLAGVIVSAVTILTGFADWLDTERGTQIRRMANAHALMMLAATGLVGVGLYLRYGSGVGPSLTLVVLGGLVLGIVTIGGTIGGSMVYDFGFNVQTASDNPVYHPSERDILHPLEETDREGEQGGSSAPISR